MEMDENPRARHLMVFPGSGNPNASPVYAQLYTLIQKLAQQAGHTHVDCDLRWPGRAESERMNRESVQHLDSSVQCAAKRIRRLKGQPYDILARSYGCWVAFAMVLSKNKTLPQPGCIILWGPVPFWIAWEMAVRDFVQTKAVMQLKGSDIDEAFFHYLSPVESMLRDTDVPTRIVAGSKDPFCTPAFVEYLKANAGINKQVQFPRVVIGARNEVTEDSGENIVEAYNCALWGAV